MYVLTNREMREADEYTIKELGVPALTLMERAGTALACEVEKLAPIGEILCVCGGGNNGGDGFVCARLLKEKGRNVSVVYFSEKISQDCRVNLERYKNIGGEIFEEIPSKTYALIVDCLFGTGFRMGVEQKTARIIKEINKRKSQGTLVLSADIPSGVNGENGVADIAVQATETLCIGELKIGVLFGDGIDCSGKIRRADIGIVLPKTGYALLSDKEIVFSKLPKRKRNSHKGSYGKAAIVGGSAAYTGAAYLAASACLRSGVGYTTLFVPEGIVAHYILKAPELLLKPLKGQTELRFCETDFAQLLVYDSIAYGMGMGISEDVAKGVEFLLKRYTGKLVLDADALNSFAVYGDKKWLREKTCDVLLTPHAKEFSRLSGESMEGVVRSGMELSKSFALQYGVNVVLKNAVSVITNGKAVFLNVVGTSGQAKGGSGDVLAGVITGVCAMGASALDGGIVGSYLTGKAAELACKERSEYALTPTDVIEYLGGAFLSLVSENSDKSGGEE